MKKTAFQNLATLLILVLGAMTLGGCAAWRGTEKGMTKLIFSPSMETSLGTEYAEQIEGDIKLIDDPEALAWLQDMGERLVAESPEAAVPFKFQLTADPSVNAFAIPGGYCYVNLGLVQYADNEAQVAAVVGHEINHVTQRHGLLRIQRAMGIGAVTAAAAILLEDQTARAAAVAGGTGVGFLANQRWSRDDEREADKLGTEAMYLAGWDPRESAKFFQKLNDLSGGKTPGALDRILSTHPVSADRVENINKQVAGYDLNAWPLTVNTPRFEAVKDRLKKQYGEIDFTTPAAPAEPAPTE
jgi:predicted Zn-dependent protease